MSSLIILDCGFHHYDLYSKEYSNSAELVCPDCIKSMDYLIILLEKELLKNGYQVQLIRKDRNYITPSQAIHRVNDTQAFCLFSFHPYRFHCPSKQSAIEISIYERNTKASRLAYSLCEAFEAIGYKNYGVNERSNLTILRRSKIPALFMTFNNLPLYDDNPNSHFQKLMAKTVDAFVKVLQSFSK